MENEAQFLWHTTPLFYVPHLLVTGAIFSAAQLAAQHLPVRPRPSAIRRKTRLHLADFVHLSPHPATPLLRDKQEKGYPHVLLSFCRTDVLALPGVALLRYNTKRWAHRDDFVPVTDAVEMATVWAEFTAGKYPSLEVLLPRSLPLTFAVGLHTATPEAAMLLRGVIAALQLDAPLLQFSPEWFPAPHAPYNLASVRDYFLQCESAGAVLPPPALSFD